VPAARYYYVVSTSSATGIQFKSSPVSSDSTCLVADGLGLEMSVNEVDESEDKINDVFIDSDDDNTDID